MEFYLQITKPGGSLITPLETQNPHVRVIGYVGDQSGSIGLKGPLCIFSLESLTMSQTTTMTTPNRLHNNTTVTNATADWILEHSLPGTDLANYGSRMVFDTIAHHNNSTLTIPYSGNTNAQFKMVNSNDTLSTVTPTHPYLCFLCLGSSYGTILTIGAFYIDDSTRRSRSV
jgi:hypothetical protein